MPQRWRGTLIVLGLMLIAGRAMAQLSCPTLIQDALQSVSTSCETVNRNQVCYGNLSLQATLRPDAPTFTFDSVGDILDVNQIRTLKLDGLDESRGVWGMAMMRLQADIPDTLPGQNVTFLLFGDVEIENASTDQQTPMQAFYIRSGLGDAACIDAPESGVLIQTPEGVQSVHFNVNGIDVEIGSTVMLQAQPEGALQIRTLEGAAVVTVNGNSYPVIAGTQISLSMNAQLQLEGLPSLPIPLSNIELNTLPLAPLPRAIPPAAPLPDAVMMKLQMRVKAGLNPCGVPALPACEHALTPQDQRIWANEASYQESIPTPETPLPSATSFEATPVPETSQAQPVNQGAPATAVSPSASATNAQPVAGNASSVSPAATVTDTPPSAESSTNSNVGDQEGKEKKDKDEKEKKDKKDKKEKGHNGEPVPPPPNRDGNPPAPPVPPSPGNNLPPPPAPPGGNNPPPVPPSAGNNPPPPAPPGGDNPPPPPPGEAKGKEKKDK